MEDFKQKIETLMQGTESFFIILNKKSKTNYGGSVQSASSRDKIEVYPGVDTIKFSNNKDGVNVQYIRVYSNFPPSENNFQLSVIEAVEEIIPWYINRYNNDILYDAHQTETKIQRSEARKKLEKIGKNALKLIAKQLEILFPEDKEIDQELFMAWIVLICGIIKTHTLPKSPYPSNTRYADQEVGKWITYCNQNG